MKVGLGIAEPSASMAICAAYEIVSSALTPSLVSVWTISSFLELAIYRGLSHPAFDAHAGIEFKRHATPHAQEAPPSRSHRRGSYQS
jgi:hypothetical protein